MYLQSFLNVFIPLFVAIDPLGIFPVFVSITEGVPKEKKKKLVFQATFTAFIISIVFLFAGKLVFKILGITENDFRIGGGIVLLILAITDLLFSSDEQSRSPEQKNSDHSTLGVVPIGIPLIMGPTALTTILMSVEQYGIIMTSIALIVNLILVYIIFRNTELVTKLIGPGGSKAFAKVTSLFLVAIGVMLIRVGIQNTIGKI